MSSFSPRLEKVQTMHIFNNNLCFIVNVEKLPRINAEEELFQAILDIIVDNFFFEKHFTVYFGIPY